MVCGEVVGLNQGENNKVVVRILRDDATDAERLKFLQEATPHKVKGKNGNHLVLGLVAACIKMDPLLLIFESSPWVSSIIGLQSIAVQYFIYSKILIQYVFSKI